MKKKNAKGKNIEQKLKVKYFFTLVCHFVPDSIRDLSLTSDL